MQTKRLIQLTFGLGFMVLCTISNPADASEYNGSVCGVASVEVPLKEVESSDQHLSASTTAVSLPDEQQNVDELSFSQSQTSALFSDDGSELNGVSGALTCPPERSGLSESECDAFCCSEHNLGGTLSLIGNCCFCGQFPGCGNPG